MKIRWARLAISHLDAAYEYVAADNPLAAEHLIERIEKGIAMLAKHPTAGRKGRIPNTRELVVSGTPFVIPYRVHRGAVQILAVLHGARKWPESL